MNILKGTTPEARRRFFVVVIFAVAVGFIHGLHNFLIPLELGRLAPGAAYYPMTVESNYDIGTFYAARVKAVAARNQFFSGDVNLAEYPNTPSSVPFLPSALMGITAKLLGSVERAVILSDFLFPALAFIVFYLLIARLFGWHTLAVLGSALLVFSPGWAVLATSPVYSSWRELARRFIPFLDPGSALPFLRFDYPKLTEVFYAAALLLLYEALRRPGRKGLVWAAGVSLGALLYIYLYESLYIFVGLPLLVFGFFISGEKDRAKTTLKIFGIVLAMSAFYWWNFIRLHSLPHYNDILWRLGVEVSRSFRWSSWTSAARALVLSSLVWILGDRENRVRSIYLISLLVPIVFVLNIQVVTGMNPAPDHWHRAQFLPVAMVMLFLAAFLYESAKNILGKYIFVLRAAPVFLASALLAMHFGGQIIYSAIPAVASGYALPSATVQSYRWIDKNLPDGSVIGTLAATTGAEIAMYTRQLIYLPRAFNTVAGTEELWLRAINLARILRLNEDEFKGLFGHDSDLTSFMFGDLYRSRELNSIFQSRSRDVPAEVLEERVLVFENENFVDPGFKLDYIYLGARELALYKNKTPDFDRLFGAPVYAEEDIRIYKIGD